MNKNFHVLKRYALSFLALIFSTELLVGCAHMGTSESYTLNFDTFADSPDIEVLDYQYGTNGMTRATDWQKKNLGTIQGGYVTSPFSQRGPLYVKWRVKSTGAVYEDTVDLTNRLPYSMKDKTLVFVVSVPQLYVYLVLPENRPSTSPPNGPSRFHYEKVITIYPDGPRF